MPCLEQESDWVLKAKQEALWVKKSESRRCKKGNPRGQRAMYIQQVRALYFQECKVGLTFTFYHF